jgi:hypothetical protein
MSSVPGRSSEVAGDDRGMVYMSIGYL